jgi:hypothetical protein
MFAEKKPYSIVKSPAKQKAYFYPVSHPFGATRRKANLAVLQSGILFDV